MIILLPIGKILIGFGSQVKLMYCDFASLRETKN